MEDGNEAIRSGRADAVVYGRLFLANRDLVLFMLLSRSRNESPTFKILSLVTLTTLPWTTRMLLLMLRPHDSTQLQQHPKFFTLKINPKS